MRATSTNPRSAAPVARGHTRALCATRSTCRRHRAVRVGTQDRDSADLRVGVLTAAHLLRVMLGLAIVLIVSIAIAACIGPVPTSLARAFGRGGAATADWAIIVQTRLPRLLLAAVVGAALATA